MALVDRGLRRALAFVIPYWRRLSLVLAASLASTLLSLYLPLLSRDFFDRALIGRDPQALVRIAVVFAGASLVSFGLNVISGLRYTRVSAEILFDMRLEMYRHLQQLSPRFYARTRFGDIMSRINNDIGEIQRIAAETTLAWVGNILFLGGTIVMMAALDRRLFLATVATAPLSVYALVRYRTRLETQVGVVRQRSAEIGSFLIESLQAIKLVVTSNAQEREVSRFRHRNAAFIEALMSMQRLTYFSGGLPGLILSAGSGLVMLYGGIRVINGSITVGTFVAFMAYQVRFLPPLQALMGMYTNLATARVSLRRVSQILDEPVEVREDHAATALSHVRGEVTFEHVTLTYEGRAPVLEDASFSVRPGETVAIVGASGSGKSTIADLLLRLVDPDAGVIRLDGEDVRSARLNDLRRHVALVDQEPCVLHASIAENIRYGMPDASDEQVRMAAHHAALDAFVERLPDRYQTIVGERGMALSAGERQRIAIARAFLMNPAVLILDEPSSSLDPESEQRIMMGYEAVMRDRTTIVVTHRHEVATRADRVLLLDGMRIFECRDLLAVEGFRNRTGMLAASYGDA